VHACLSRLPRPIELEPRWRELEARARPSLFTSWQWIGCWLESLPQAAWPQLLSVEEGGRTVALGTISRSVLRRARIVKSRALHLNAIGHADYDNIAIEYNGLLAEAGMERQVLRCCASHFLGQDDWDEWLFPGVDDSALFGALDLPDVLPVVEALRPCHYVDLDAVRATGKEYLGFLGRKTRYNIRRCLGEFERTGPVALEQAESVPQALAFLDELQALHQARWESRRSPGAFASSFFRRFHHRFIESGVPNGAVQLLRVRAGHRTIGCLYNFVHQGRVLCYQTGFDYALGQQYNSPGMATHALAIDFNLARGHKVYDFLAGRSQYKQQLGTHSFDMVWMSLRRNRGKFRAVDWLRMRKASLTRAFQWIRRLRRTGEPALPPEGESTRGGGPA
jgi:CelD/BcsL family acetyltransferase involved in cellulose biosynthesis